MTATTHRTLLDSTDSLLRFAMRVDATICAATGLLVAMAADSLSRLSGLSASAEWILGAALAVYGVVLYVVAAAPALRTVGTAVVVGNIVASAAIVTALWAGWVVMTPAGVALALGFVAMTLALAYVQYLGVRRLT